MGSAPRAGKPSVGLRGGWGLRKVPVPRTPPTPHCRYRCRGVVPTEPGVSTALPCPQDARQQDSSGRTQPCVAASAVALGDFEGVTGAPRSSRVMPRSGDRSKDTGSVVLPEILPPTNIWAQLGDAALSSEVPDRGTAGAFPRGHPPPKTLPHFSHRRLGPRCPALCRLRHRHPQAPLQHLLPAATRSLGITHPHPGWKRLGKSQGSFLADGLIPADEQHPSQEGIKGPGGVGVPV